ncbi:MAG: diguanylate cyclase [Peptococcaceae bacterium]|nr:diguanylate cyclase [Peptococcaceae bacterium]
MKINIGSKLLLSFSAILLLVTVLAGLTVYNNYTIGRSAKIIPAQMDKIYETSQIRSNVLMQSSSIRAYMLYHDEQFLEDFRQLAKKNAEKEEKLIETIRPERKPLARRIKELNDRYTRVCENEIVPLVKAGLTEQSALAAANGEGLKLARELAGLTAELENMRYQDTLLIANNTIAITDKAVRSSVLFTILALLLGGVSIALTTRRIIQDNNIYRLILATTKNAVLTVDAAGRITNFNLVAANIFDMPEKAVLGKRFDQVFTGRGRPGEVALEAPLMEVLETGEGRCGEEKIYVGTDGWRHVLMVDCLPFETYHGRPVGAMMIARDITERKVIEERLQGLAVRDSLTGLYNHRFLKERLYEEVERASREGVSLSFMIMDIDNFKYCNDRFGHMIGDEILKIFSRVLKENLRQYDIVGRYGGDEFAAILPRTDSKTAYDIAERLRQVIQEHPFPQREKMPEGRLTVSVGIAAYPKNTTSCWDLIKLADEAMYQAKRSSKNKVELYFSVLQDFQKELDESEHSLIDNVKTMLMLINSKDRYTYRHSEQVVHYTELIAAGMGLPAEEVKNIKMAGFLHDIGKIEISQEILNKVEPLTTAEWALIRRHPNWGANIIRPFSSMSHLAPLVLHHHERYDGKGYPHGLAGENIPLGARIIAVADSFDAMTTERPYKKAMTFEEAMEELKNGMGSQFDPAVVSAFLDILRRKRKEFFSQTA